MQESATVPRASRQKRFFAVTILLVLGITGLLSLVITHETESREAAYWIRGTSWQNPRLSPAENSQRRLEALKRIGQPAITVLIRDVRHGGENGTTRYGAFFSKMPAYVRRFLPRPQMPTRSRRVAISLLGQLGPLAKPAVPDLLELLHSGDQPSRQDVARALGQIGDSQPEVLSALRNLYSDADNRVRQAASLAVWRLDDTDQQAAARIEATLVNTNRHVVEQTSGDTYHSLIALGPKAKRFAPALALGMTNLPALTLKPLAAKALWRIEHSSGPALYVLDAITNALASAPVPASSPTAPDIGAYVNAFFACQELSEVPEFRSAVKPFLGNLTNSSNSVIARMARDSLLQLEQLESAKGNR